MSISFLSQVERGTSSLAITSLKKISDVFNVPITYFFEAAKRSDVIMKTLFGVGVAEDARMTMGTVVFPPGARVPAEGTGVHAEHEYAYVINGSLLTMSGGKEYRLSRGQGSFIPAGEAHWSLNDGTEDCELIWALVEKG